MLEPLVQHPEARGEIALRNMVPRKPRIKVAAFAEDAFKKWRAGESKVELAKEYQCAIKRTIKNLGYTWVVVKVYRDDAISGKFMRRRPAFQRMLNDLRSGLVKADLILLDTRARLARSKEMAAIRNELRNRGILILTATSNFANPETREGQALEAIDDIVSTGENADKAHNIWRGKWDAVQQKRWPGGPAPKGFMLETVMKMESGRQVVDYSRLIPHPDDRHVMEIAFQEADKFGFGQIKLAKHLNAHPGKCASHLINEL